MAAVKDGEFSRRARWMFWRSTKNLSNAAGYLERGKIEDASEKIEEAIRKIKRAARMERRNSALKVMCEEFIQDLEKPKAEIKEEVNNHYKEDHDEDHDDDDDRHHDDDDDDDDDDHDHDDDDDDEDDD
jgi:hypothetical protein